MSLAFTLLSSLALISLFAYLGQKIKIPIVISLIICGLILGIPQISEFIIRENSKVINHLGELGLTVLLFLAGLETSWQFLFKKKSEAALIAFCGFFTSFILGFVLFRIIGFSNLVASIVGVSLAITAEGTTARVLFDLKKLKTRLGAAMIGAGIVDDLLGIGAFILITTLLGEFDIKKDFVILTSIGAFFVGLLAQKLLGRHHKIIKFFENTLMFGVVPFFFISMGMHFDFASLVFNENQLMLVVAVAILGKFLGVFFAKPFTGFSWKQVRLIGWAMNSRGAIGLGLILAALNMGLIDSQLYSSLVVMTLVTTLFFPFVIEYDLKRDKKIMD